MGNGWRRGADSKMMSLWRHGRKLIVIRDSVSYSKDGERELSEVSRPQTAEERSDRASLMADHCRRFKGTN